MLRWCKWCSCLGPRHGFWTPSWRNPSRGFTTGRHGRCRSWDPNFSKMGHGCTHPLGGELEMVGLEDIGVYITHRQNTVTQYITTCTIIYLCLAAKWKTGMRLSRRWWKQPALNILGIRVDQAAAEGGGGGWRKNRRQRDRESRLGADEK